MFLCWLPKPHGCCCVTLINHRVQKTHFLVCYFFSHVHDAAICQKLCPEIKTVSFCETFREHKQQAAEGEQSFNMLFL